jgi:hypothetical protein
MVLVAGHTPKRGHRDMMLIKPRFNSRLMLKQVRREKRSEDMQKRFGLFFGGLAMATIALAPAKVSAGWGWWGGPGISIYVCPR